MPPAQANKRADSVSLGQTILSRSALAGVALRSPAREAVNTKERQQWKRLADSPTQCASLNLM
jgi:hypothetical protein